MSEQGDAAVSVDRLGRLRVWTALDGSREPVPISAPDPVQIAVAGTGFEVVVAVLDESGSAHVLRLGRDGVTRGRAQVPGDVAITQLVALGDHLLALRADQTIEELDGSGVVRSRIAAEPGERIGSLVVRAGGVLAVLVRDDGTANTVRWIDHGNGLVWGLRVTLPAAIAPESVALSPSHRLLAAAEAKSRQMFVYDISVQPALATSTDVQLTPGEPVGFVDDQDVAALSPVRWWRIGAPKPADPWAPTTPPNPIPASSMAPGAAANGFVASALGASLAIVTEQRIRYIGWSEINPSSSTLVGDHVAISTSGHHFAWLDRSLRELHAIDLDANAFGSPIDDRHVITERSTPHGGLRIELVDVDHPDPPVTIGDFANVTRFELEPHSQVLFVGDGTAFHRYHLDLAHDTFTELPVVKTQDESSFTVLDPATAGGAFAAIGTAEGSGTRIDELRDEGGKVVRRKRLTVPGMVAAVDDHGGVWWRERADRPIHHGEVTLPAADVITTDHGGENALLFDGASLALYDRDGKARWHVPAWRASTFQFTPDDRQVVVRGMGGLFVLDVASGERVAAACGWQFGISDKAPDSTPSGFDSVCEDSER